MTQRIRRVGLDWLSPERVAAHLAGDVRGLRVLDFGCGSGVLLDCLAGARVRAGVDVSQEALSRARARCGRDVFLVRVGIHGALPFADETFHLAVSTEVLEHVPDERLVLGEIARVLRPGGRLILTTPHKHWLSGLDVGNLKFRFPRLHAFFRVRMGGMSPEAFGRRYGGENGLIGDISVQVEPWHRHYSLDQLRRLTESILEIERYVRIRATGADTASGGAGDRASPGGVFALVAAPGPSFPPGIQQSGIRHLYCCAQKGRRCCPAIHGDLSP